MRWHTARMNSLDPFAQSFDSIEIDRKTAPSPDVLDLAIDAVAKPPTPVADQPGFYLIDDADGRFVIDRDMGIISLRDERLLAIESGAIHQAHVRVVELSGTSYELKFRLRLTGRVPQIAGAEENDVLASLASAPIPDLMAPQEKILAPQPQIPWLSFAAAALSRGKAQLYGETAPFGTLFAGPVLPGTYEETAEFMLLESVPKPSAAVSDWTI